MIDLLSEWIFLNDLTDLMSRKNCAAIAVSLFKFSTPPIYSSYLNTFLSPPFLTVHQSLINHNKFCQRGKLFSR